MSEQGGAAPDSLRSLGEFGLIARLTRRAAAAGAPTGDRMGVEVGVGDDAAVLLPTPGARLVATADVLVEGHDFRPDLSEPADWGWKAVAANLSDLAAMGARGRWLLLALTAPAATPPATLERLYDGVGEACRTFDVALVGGDVSDGPALSLAVTALGEATGPVVTRAGARPGDRLVVSGPLGAAAAGLALLELSPRRGHDAAGGVAAGDQARELLARFPDLATAQRRPRPDLGAGPRLAQAGAHAMVDVSDGLAGDALHLAEASGIGVELRDRDVPLAPGVAEAAALLGRDPLELALGGGEDFVLAAALPPDAGDVAGVIDCGAFVRAAVHGPGRGARRTATGTVLPLDGEGLGYQHFRR